MIEVMEHAEQATDGRAREAGGVRRRRVGGICRDDFILQAMGGGRAEKGETTASPRRLRTFPPIRLRYDEAEVENELATLEEIVEEEALRGEEEAELANGPAWFRGGGGMFGR